MLVKGSGQLAEGIERILLIQLGDIGDVVLSFPCVRALRQRFPNAAIQVAVRDKAAELVTLCPGADGVIPVSKGGRGPWQELCFQAGFFRDLRRHRFDLAIDLRTGTRGALLALLSGARQRIGFYAEDGTLWRNRLFTDLFRPEVDPEIHQVRYLLDLLEAFGVAAEQQQPEFVISEARKKAALALLAAEGVPTDRPLIAVQPFSLWQYKEWGREKVAGLIRWLRDTYGAAVLITGAAGEREVAGQIAAACGSGVYNLAGRTTIAEYGALLSLCRLFVGMDSAGQHLAAAAGVPTLILYGPSKPASWAPVGPSHRVVRKPWPCVPCCQMGCDDSGRSRCLDELSLAEVLPAVAELMGSCGQPALR